MEWAPDLSQRCLWHIKWANYEACLGNCPILRVAQSLELLLWELGKRRSLEVALRTLWPLFRHNCLWGCPKICKILGRGSPSLCLGFGQSTVGQGMRNCSLSRMLVPKTHFSGSSAPVLGARITLLPSLAGTTFAIKQKPTPLLSI